MAPIPDGYAVDRDGNVVPVVVLEPGWPTWLASPRVVPTVGLPAVSGGCGCGQGRA